MKCIFDEAQAIYEALNKHVSELSPDEKMYAFNPQAGQFSVVGDDIFWKSQAAIKQFTSLINVIAKEGKESLNAESFSSGTIVAEAHVIAACRAIFNKEAFAAQEKAIEALNSLTSRYTRSELRRPERKEPKVQHDQAVQAVRDTTPCYLAFDVASRAIESDFSTKHQLIDLKRDGGDYLPVAGILHSLSDRKENMAQDFFYKLSDFLDANPTLNEDSRASVKNILEAIGRYNMAQRSFQFHVFQSSSAVDEEALVLMDDKLKTEIVDNIMSIIPFEEDKEQIDDLKKMASKFLSDQFPGEFLSPLKTMEEESSEASARSGPVV